MPKKLLLADDSVTIQRVIELTFSGEDIQVIAVGDGEAAIASISAEKPDIVLADIGMPKRSGYEVSAFVKNNPELTHIPVLLLAGAFEPVDDAKAKEARCDGVLVKPFEPQLVIARVRELMGGAKGSPTQPAVQDIARPAARLAPPRPVDLPRREDRPRVPDNLMDVGEADLAPRAVEAESTAAAAVVDESLDDYFDKLDEAFSTADGSVAAGAAGSRPDTRSLRPDRPVLERDLESFDAPSFISDLSAEYVEASRDPAVDPFDFDGMAQVEAGEAAAVPTLDDLLSSMPLPAASTPMTFEAPPAPMIFDSPSAPVIDLPVQRPLATVAPPVFVAPPSIEPPDVTPTLAPGPALVAAPTSDSGSGRSIIAEAFSALFAAEQGEPGATPIRFGTNGSAPVVTDAMVDDVAKRVIQRLALGSSDQMNSLVKQIVSDVAERLVREEIDRIRSISRH
jgi:CheY-like chemotaxis protein